MSDRKVLPTSAELPALEEALQWLLDPPIPDAAEFLKDEWHKAKPESWQGQQKVNKLRYRQLVATRFAAFHRIRALEGKLAGEKDMVM